MTMPVVPEQGPRRIRAGDADREHTVEILRTHYTQGRLDLEEFTTRMETAYAATYTDEFAILLADLPPAPKPAAPPRPRGHSGPRIFVLGPLAITLGAALLFTVGALAGGHPPFGLIWLLLIVLWFHSHPHRRRARRWGSRS
jgi:Domain of unknown function (DUF1707)